MTELNKIKNMILTLANKSDSLDDFSPDDWSIDYTLDLDK